MAINETATGKDSIAITGTATGEGSIGVHAKGDAVGIRGDGKSWHGVVGFSEGGFGVYGEGLAGGSGVVGKSKGWHAVAGFSESTTGGFGVYGEAVGTGVVGVSKNWIGVYGETAAVENGPAGVWGEHKGAGVGVKAVSKDGAGLAAYSNSYEAIHAETKSSKTAAIAAYNANPASQSPVLYCKHNGAGPAALFDGNAIITGSLSVGGQNIAELISKVNSIHEQGARVTQLENKIDQLVNELTNKNQALHLQLAALQNAILQLQAISHTHG